MQILLQHHGLVSGRPLLLTNFSGHLVVQHVYSELSDRPVPARCRCRLPLHKVRDSIRSLDSSKLLFWGKSESKQELKNKTVTRCSIKRNHSDCNHWLIQHWLFISWRRFLQHSVSFVLAWRVVWCPAGLRKLLKSHKESFLTRESRINDVVQTRKRKSAL